MNADELLQEWEEGETTGVRPARVKEIRDDLSEVTGVYVPRRPSEIEGWLDKMKGQVTRKLRVAAEGGDEDDEDDSSSD